MNSSQAEIALNDRTKDDSTNTLKKIFSIYLIVFAIIASLLVLFFAYGQFIMSDDQHILWKNTLRDFFDIQFFIYFAVGLFAQLIDGSLGMAYGVSSTTFLMSAGVPPAAASASVHVAEVFTTGISGLSHWRFGNVNKKLFFKLAIPGSIGAAMGAFILTSVDGNFIKPYVSIYLLIMGIVIILKALKKFIQFKAPDKVGLLALAGGFLDNIGGGGWGPVVTTTLLGRGAQPRTTIGSVNSSEFFVSLTGAGVFTLLIGLQGFSIIAGLILGGIIAAPLGAYICSRINTKTAMIFVGILIIVLSTRTVIKSIGL